jgi:hypothetical protein
MKFQKYHMKRFIQAVEKFGINLISSVFILIFSFTVLSGNLWADSHTAATCSQTDVAAAITTASDGDIVLIPAGNCTWGENGTYLSVNKKITLQGAGQGQTNIILSDLGRLGLLVWLG